MKKKLTISSSSFTAKHADNAGVTSTFSNDLPEAWRAFFHSSTFLPVNLSFSTIPTRFYNIYNNNNHVSESII